MRILIDGMGGDNAPEEIVAGVIDAAKEIDSRRESAKRFRNGKGNKT